MTSSNAPFRLLVATCLFLLVASLPVARATPAPPQPPPESLLTIEALLALQGHNARSTFEPSPDGLWLAHTIETAARVPRGSNDRYSVTGFPFAEGNAHMRATLSRLDGTESVDLGAPGAVTWAPTWSPDGRHVAFYSDEGGAAGLWIWSRDSRRSRRIEGLIVRPLFGFEAPRWSPDGRLVAVKALPEGVTLEEASALLGRRRPASATAAAGPSGETTEDGPSVSVRTSQAMRERGEATASDAPAPGAEADDPFAALLRAWAADLVLVDPRAGTRERVARGEALRRWAFSPDGDALAWASIVGFVPNAQQARFALRVVDLERRGDELRVSAPVTVADDFLLGYGIEWSWSPDGERLAVFESGQKGSGEVVLLPVDGGDPLRLEGDAPPLAAGEGEVTPAWTRRGSVLGIAEGSLWEIPVDGGAHRRVAASEEWEMTALVTEGWPAAAPFTTDDGGTLWVVARTADARRRALLAVDAASGAVRVHFEESASWSGIFSLAASPASAEVLLFSRNQQRLGDVWAVSVGEGSARPRKVTALNPQLDDLRLGEARILEWTSDLGEELGGTLLLPPGHRSDDPPPPLVVWVYGGAMGSRSLHSFGIWGSAPAFNLHLLASRGYAVLHPDAPLREGHLTDDLVAAVMPGVDAAVAAGFADPQRLAVMGQSFGSLNVLSLLTRTDRFRAAVITAAVIHPDLFADYVSDESTGYWEAGQGQMGGTVWEVPERYRRNSPLFEFDRITTPLLIGQGALDGDLVPSSAIFNALDRLGRQVELRVYEGEDHVISDRANVEDFWRRRLDFLEEHLGAEAADGGGQPEASGPEG